MSGLIRHAAAFGLAGLITAWLLFSAPAPSLQPSPPGGAPSPVLVDFVDEVAVAQPVTPQPVTPQVEQPQEKMQPPGADTPQVVDTEEAPDRQEPARAPESGSRTAVDDGEADAAAAREEVLRAEALRAETLREEARQAEALEADRLAAARAAQRLAEREAQLAETRALRNDPKLLELARNEISGEAKTGFSTVLVSAPREQIDIARHFDEQVVLVPKSALDPEAASPHYFVLDPGSPNGVRRVERRPTLERFRQYRDFTSYEFKELPVPLRTLRMSVVRRDEIFLFGALIPASEWALVIGRRRDALQRLELDEDSVEQFRMSYVSGPGGSYDIRVDDIVTADGRRHSLPDR